MAKKGKRVLRLKFRMAVADVFEEQGKKVLREVLEEHPDDFLEFVEKVMGTDARKRIGLDPSEADLDLLVRCAVEGGRRGTPDEGKPAPGRMN